MNDSDQEVLHRLLPDHAGYGRVGRVPVDENEFVEILASAYAMYKDELYVADGEGSLSCELIGEHLSVDAEGRIAESENHMEGGAVRFKLAWATEGLEAPVTVFAWTIYKHVFPASVQVTSPLPETGYGVFTQHVHARFENPLLPQRVNFEQVLFKAALPFVTRNVLESVPLLDWIISNTRQAATRLPFGDYLSGRPEFEQGGRRFPRQYYATFGAGGEKIERALAEAARGAGSPGFVSHDASRTAVVIHPSSTDVAVIFKWEPAEEDAKSTLSFFIYELDPYFNSELKKLPADKPHVKNYATAAGPDLHSLNAARSRASSWVRGFIESLARLINTAEADLALIEKLMPEYGDHVWIKKFPVNGERFLDLLKTTFKENFLESNRRGTDRAELIIGEDRRSAEATLYAGPDPVELRVAKMFLRWTQEEGRQVSTCVAWTFHEYWTRDINRPPGPNRTLRPSHLSNLIHQKLFNPISDIIKTDVSQNTFRQMVGDQEELWRTVSSLSDKSSVEEVKVRAERIPEVLRFIARVAGIEATIYEEKMIAALHYPNNALLLKWQPGPTGNNTAALHCIKYGVLSGEASGKKDSWMEGFYADLRELILRLPPSSLDGVR